MPRVEGCQCSTCGEPAERDVDKAVADLWKMFERHAPDVDDYIKRGLVSERRHEQMHNFFAHVAMGIDEIGVNDDE